MSLADSIYEANDNSSKSSFLNSLVEMAVENSIKSRRDEFTIYQLHLRDGKIYYGHDMIVENEANVYLFTEYEERIPKHIGILFWKRIKERLPVIDKDIIQISDNLFWDKNNGEIINKEEIYESQIYTKKS